MSTDYGFLCLDCQAAYILDEERRPETIAEIIAIAPDVGKLRSKLPALDLYVRVGYGGQHLDLGWFEKHGEHRLDVVDEYGGRYPRCDRTYFDAQDNTRRPRYCMLKEDHRPGSECSDMGWRKRP